MGEAIVLHVDLSRLSSEAGDNGYREELISSSMSWNNLQLKIKYIAGRDDITISYCDEDNDVVLIESQDELQEAYKVALKMDNILPLVVMTGDGVPFAKIPAKKPSAESMGKREKKNAGQGAKTKEDRADKKKMKKQANECETETHKKKSHKKVKVAGEHAQSEGKYCHPETGEAGPSDARDVLPPSWFQHYMNKFRKEMTTEFSKVAAEKTARRVLRSMNSMSGQRKCDSELGRYTLLPSMKSDASHGAPCRGCMKTIVGIRYKCGNCLDFDLCETCEELDGIHDKTHVFLKIRQPLRRKHGCIWHAPLLKRNLYQTKDSRASGKSKCDDDKVFENAEVLPEAAAAADSDSDDYGTGCAFIRDDNIPDGTHMQPRTRFTKRWIVKNIGLVAWTPDVRLTMFDGLIDCVMDSVPVPPLIPEEMGCVSVDLTAPAEPGNYEATWVMTKAGCLFGHKLWCSIVVDEKEVLEPLTTATLATMRPLICDSYPEEEVPLLGAMSQMECSEEAVVVCSDEEEEDADVVGEELLTEYCALAKLSHTATPSNTPLAYTPPMTPIPPQLEQCIRSLTLSDPELPSTNHINDELEPIFDDAKADEYLEFADCYDDTDVNSDSSDDSDFFIVPVPDCFRTDLPASLTASTNRVIRKSNTNKPNDGSKRQEITEMLQKSEAEIVGTEIAADAEAVLDNTASAGALNDEAAADSTSECDTADDEVGEVAKEDDVECATEAPAPEHFAAAGLEQSANGELANAYDPLADLGDLAWSGAKLVGAAAMWGAKAARNVYQHMQAHNEYVPPQSKWTPSTNAWTPPTNTWTPPATNWVPPVSNWTPPANNWTPPEQQWVPPETTWVSTTEEWLHPDAPSDDPNHKMLLDMGFANRERNQRLLQKHNNDVHAVISELIAENDNDWSARRH